MINLNIYHVILYIYERNRLYKYHNLVHTSQVNSAFGVLWLASSEVISQVLG